MDEIKGGYMTTRPIIPAYSELPTLKTSNPLVFLRPFQAGDLDSFHQLRTQIDVMKWTTTGKIDASVDQTRMWMGRFFDFDDSLLPYANKDIDESLQRATVKPRSFNFAIVSTEKVLEQTEALCSGAGEVIGVAGCHIIDPEPECGYMIRKEYWHRGIATAVMRAILDLYWSFERRTAYIPASRSPKQAFPNDSTCESHISNKNADSAMNGTQVREVLKATIVTTNIGSRRVLEKCGFQYKWCEVVQELGEDIVLAHYDLPRPDTGSTINQKQLSPRETED